LRNRGNKRIILLHENLKEIYDGLLSRLEAAAGKISPFLKENKTILTSAAIKNLKETHEQLLSKLKANAGKVPPFLKKNKKILITAAVLLPAGYIADVWLIGTASAGLYDMVINFGNAQDKVNSASWYFGHPFTVSWAWLTKSAGELTSPGVRKLWAAINLLFGGAALAMYCRGKWRKILRNKNDSKHVHGLKVVDNPAYGTSRWAGLKDLESFCEFGPPLAPETNARFPGGNVIGQLDGKIVRVNFEKMPNDTPKTAPHAVAYGGTGSGKTFGFVSENIISAVSDGQSIVLIDPKGELYERFAPWLRIMGYQVSLLNFMTPEHSNRWNPVIECQNDAEISEMVHTLSVNVVGPKPVYFQLKAMELMEALIGLLKADFPVEQQHMRSLMTLAAWPVEELDLRFKKAYFAKKISPFIFERWSGVSKKNYEYAVSNLTAMLKNLTTEPLAALLSEQEINLSDIGRKKTALFLCIPTGGEGEYLKPILSIFYKFLFKRLDKLAYMSPGKTLPVKVRNIWDEMANVGMIPGLPEIISTARSKGIHILMILQTPTQLDYVYGYAEAKTILGNCPTVMLIGIAPADRELAQMFSEKLGDAAVEMDRVSEDLTVPVKNKFAFIRKVRTVSQRPLMTIDEVLRINPKDCIALLQWSYPVYLKKVGWTKLPQAEEIIKCGALPAEKAIPARGFEISLPELPGLDSTEGIKDTGGDTGDSMLWGIMRTSASQGKLSLPEEEPPDKEYSISSLELSDEDQVQPQPQARAKANEAGPDKTENPGEPTESIKPPEDSASADTQAEDVESRGFNVSSPIF
jgi:type IV secretory pathway TraG/TraD family ATPase VirD4